MSADWNAEALLEPIAPERPCGENLEDTFLLSALDGLRVFGQDRSPDAPPVATGPGAAVRPPIEWGKLREDALEALERSRDLRPLAYLGAALLRTSPLPAYTRTLSIAAQWLETYWPSVYPSIDEDALERRNALNCLADPMAVVERVRRIPLVDSRVHGRFSYRDIELATGTATPAKNEKVPELGAIEGAFQELPFEALRELDDAVAAALEAMKAIEAKMRSECGAEMVPAFDPLAGVMGKVYRFLHEKVVARTPPPPPEPVEVAEPGAAPDIAQGGTVGYQGGTIRTREEALRALEAVEQYFRAQEPSSPVPFFIERARRLVSKDFFEVLADIAPDAVELARSVTGLKNQ